MEVLFAVSTVTMELLAITMELSTVTRRLSVVTMELAAITMALTVLSSSPSEDVVAMLPITEAGTEFLETQFLNRFILGKDNRSLPQNLF